MNDGKRVAVVRVRGTTSLAPKFGETFRLLGLTRVNHCVIVKRTSSISGMINVVKDYVAWGEVDAPTLAAMVEKRGRLVGDKEVTEALLKASGFSSFKDLSEKVIAGKSNLADVPGLKKVFRLHPPRKGYKKIKEKRPYGALGNYGAEINALIKRMV